MSEIPGKLATAALSPSSRPGPLLPARSSTVGISTGAAPPLADIKTPPHPHSLTDGRNRGKTEKVIRKDGIEYYRKPKAVKPPKDRKMVKAARAYCALRKCGMASPEIAEQLGLSVHTLRMYVKFAAQRGWLKSEELVDPVDRLEDVISHQVVDNIEAVLKEKEVIVDKETGAETETRRMSNRAVDMTKEAARGMGYFKTHQVTKSEGSTNVGVALKVDVVMPPTGPTPMVRPGSAGGTPAFDAEIIEGDGHATE